MNRKSFFKHLSLLTASAGIFARAAEAAKAGISANDYAEQAVSAVRDILDHPVKTAEKLRRARAVNIQ